MNSKSLLLLLPVLAGTALAAPVDIGAGISTYSQNFDVLVSTPNNGVSTPSTWTDDTTIPGWSLFRASNTATPAGYVSATAPYPYSVTDGSAVPNAAPMAFGFYSAGVSGAPDRALGSSSTTAQGEQSAILVLRNPNANSVRLTNVKFNVEAYRQNATANNNDSIFMYYRVVPTAAAATALTTGPADATIFPPTVSSAITLPQYYITGWTALDEFRHTQSSANVGQVTPVGVAPFNAAPTSSPVVVPAGQFLAIRWSNMNDGAVDAILGIDDLELTFTELSGSVAPVITNIVREPGALLGDFSDDTIAFDMTVTGSGAVSPAGWVTPVTSAVAPSSAGAYGALVHFSRPVAEFGATGIASITVQDAADANVAVTIPITAPRYFPKVTAALNPGITFTPSAAGATSLVNPFNGYTELGWSNAPVNATNVVEVQPANPTNSGNKYFVHTAVVGTLTTDPVSLSEIGGQAVELEVGMGLYTTTASGLEDPDNITVFLEVALDGNFGNAAPGNLFKTKVAGVDGVTPPLGVVYSDTIKVAAVYEDLDAVGFPAADFNIPKFKSSIPVPAGSAATALARMVYASVTGVTTEHVLIDDVVFRAVTTDSLVVSTPTAITRNVNGPGPADDTVSFSVDITGLGVSPLWNATSTTSVTPASGPYGAGNILTVPAGLNVNQASVTITDSIKPALTQTVIVRFNPIYLIGTVDLGGGQQDLFSIPVDPAGQAWANTPGTKTTAMNNAGNTNAKSFTSATVSLAGSTQVAFTLSLRDESNGFEAGDHFEVRAILNGNTASPVNLITDNLAGSYDDGGTPPGALNPGVANDGFLSGSELVPDPDPNPDYTVNTAFTKDLLFRYAFPAGTTSAAIVFTSTNESPNEFVTITNLLFSLNNFADADGDGMEDSYEDNNGLNKNDPTDKLTDFDGDGQNNYVEYLAGTTANDPASFLHITDGTLDITTGAGSTTWTSVAGKKYRIQLTGDLTAPWTDAPGTVTATGTTTTANYTIPGAPLTGKGFLRVKVVP